MASRDSDLAAMAALQRIVVRTGRGSLVGTRQMRRARPPCTGYCGTGRRRMSWRKGRL